MTPCRMIKVQVPCSNASRGLVEKFASKHFFSSSSSHPMVSVGATLIYAIISFEIPAALILYPIAQLDRGTLIGHRKFSSI